MRVSVSPSPVAVAVLVEEAEPEQVDHQTQRPDQQDHLGVVDVLRLVEALEALHGDGEAQGDLLWNGKIPELNDTSAAPEP